MEKVILIAMVIQLVFMVGYFIYLKTIKKDVLFIYLGGIILATGIYFNYGLNNKPVIVEVVKDRAYYERMVEVKAIEHNIPIEIAKSLIEVESNWKVDAISYAQAVGLCQVLPSTFVIYADKGYNIMEPSDNIEVSFRYLENLYKYDNNWSIVLGKYNGGKYWKSAECQGYARKILTMAWDKKICLK